jgi:hypothetical protein
VEFFLSAEPRLRFIRVGPPVIEAVYDDRGRSMLPPEPPAAEPGPGPGGGVPPQIVLRHRELGGEGNTQAMLSPPSEGARRIKSIKGAVPATVLIGHRTTVLLEKIQKGAKFTIDGRTYTVTDAKNRPGAGMDLLIKLERGGSEADLIALVEASLKFTDRDGRHCRHDIAGQEMGDALRFLISSGRTGAIRTSPARLEYEAALTREIRIPFEFRNIPLP